MQIKKISFFSMVVIVCCSYAINSGAQSVIMKEQTDREKFIPFSYERRSIMLKALVNDKYEGAFVFDSGLTTYYNLFYNNFGNGAFALPMQETANNMFGVGVMHTVNVSKKKVKFNINGFTIEGYYGFIVSSNADENGLSGVLNVHIFKDSIVEFDFVKKRLVFHHNFNDLGYKKISIIQKGSVRMIDVRATLDNGFQIDGRFLLDTGFHGFIDVYSDKKQIDSLYHKYRISKLSEMKNFGKTVDLYKMDCSHISINGMKIRNPIIRIGDTSLPDEAKGEIRGLIGVNFFEKVCPIIDFKRNVMYIKDQTKDGSIYEFGSDMLLLEN